MVGHNQKDRFARAFRAGQAKIGNKFVGKVTSISVAEPVPICKFCKFYSLLDQICRRGKYSKEQKDPNCTCKEFECASN